MAELETKIQLVTVYPDRARVTHAGRIEVSAGLQCVEIGDLPPTLLPESLRARGSGTARARLLSVGGEIAYYVRPPQVSEAELERKIEELRDRDRVLNDQEGDLGSHAEYLNGLAQAAGANLTRGVAFGRLDTEGLAKFGAYLAQEKGKTSGDLQRLQIERRELQREIIKLQKELEQVRAPRSLERYRADIELDVAQPGALELELSYVVSGAGWQPLYDLRVSEDAQIELNYLAEVSQRTGEDWTDVHLALSTAKPAVTAQLPELRPWFINPYTPPPLMRAKVAMAADARAGAGLGMALPANMDGMMAEMAAPAPMPEADMEVATAEVKESGSGLTYEIKQKASISGDGAPHKTTIAIVTLPSKLDYLTAPKLVANAYRRAIATNDSELIFLPGKASIFWGGDYIGASRLKNVAPGQEFEVFLGVDESIHVERKMILRETDKRLLSNRRRVQYGYRISLQNLTKREAMLLVHDQLPVARHEEIKVQLTRTSVPPEQDSEMGLLKWKLALQPGEKKQIEFEFAVESPREMNIVGLPD
jgi:uncharacterized protein (TIGR02231 family)